MAVVRSANIISASANADVIEGPLRLDKISVQAGAGGLTIRLRKGVVGGAVLFEEVLGANEYHNSDYKLRVPAVGLYVEIAAGAGTIYLASE